MQRPYIWTLIKGLSNSCHSLSFSIQFTLHSPEGTVPIFSPFRKSPTLPRSSVVDALASCFTEETRRLGEAHTPTTAPGAPGRRPAVGLFSPRRHRATLLWYHNVPFLLRTHRLSSAVIPSSHCASNFSLWQSPFC